ncbi:MAG: hypothetical protein JWM73_1949 [Solirubrobacterales bacterium]|nr:hypothetical protein [Solirubrobacterales bacterium]
MTLLPAPGKVLTGVAMGYELDDFTQRAGRKPAVWEQFISFDRSFHWAIDLAEREDTRLMLAVSTAPGQDQAGSISPGAIAAGRGDRWLLTVRNAFAAFARPAYLRFLGEMNNCHNAYAPMSCNGASRGARYSAAAFIAAWRRTAAIMRGDSFPAINARLRALHQHALRAPAVPLVPAQIAMVWSPMTGGSPMVGALDPARFWPGRRWVDWVGTSFYSRYPNFDWLTTYYQRFAQRYRRPFMFAEWAMWENGDPGFVRSVLGWTRSHPRTRMLVYNQGKDPEGPFRLKHFPAAALALRLGLGSGLFSAR